MIQMHNYGLAWFDLLWYNCVPTFNFPLLLELVNKFTVVVVWKATLVFICGPDLSTRILLRNGSKLNKTGHNMSVLIISRK